MHLKKLGRVLVLEILNRDNNENLTFDDVVFRNPIPMVVNEGIRNTELVVERAVGSNYRNQQTVKYWRIDIAKVIREAERTIPGRGVTSTEDIVNLLNDFYDLALDNEDIVFEAIDTTALPVVYRLKTNTLSYAYIGEVDLVLSNELIPLKTVIRTNILEDYLSTVLDDTTGNVLGAVGGILEDFNNLPDTNFRVVDNDELQLAVAVAMGSDVSVGPNVLTLADTMQIQVEETLNWNLLMSIGLLNKHRLGEDLPITDFADVFMKITHLESTLSYSLMLVIDDATGGYTWTSDRVNGLFPPVNTKTTKAYTHFYFEMQTFLGELFRHHVQQTEWAALGSFDISITALPKAAINLGRLSLESSITVTQ